MCGILAIVSAPNLPSLPNWPFWGGATENANGTSPLRVPTIRDLLFPLERRGPDGTQFYKIDVSSQVTIHAAETVLSMRGTFNRHNKSALNTHYPGSVLLYNGEIYDDRIDLNPKEQTSDTHFLEQLLNKTLQSDESSFWRELNALRGPWALIFWSPITQRLYFGRDCLGRRSLLIHAVPNSYIAITSVPPADTRYGYIEIPPVGLAYIDFTDVTKPKIKAHLRPSQPVIPTRVRPHESKTVIAGSAANMYVSFLPAPWLRSSRTKNCREQREDMSPAESAQTLITLLEKSVRRRLATNRPGSSYAPRFAILFSGGIDSMVLARLLDNEIPSGEPLHLINVAFGDGADALSECPDRRTAIEGLQELRKLSPSRRSIDLICVNASTREAHETLNFIVRPLIHPCDQPMDATIGTAIWLAARGRGQMFGTNDTHLTSPARILFSGLGADELMGGYKGRHRTIYRREGLDSVSREMDADLSRLWFRNLGRDDRLVADHGRELRHPFLDEDVIAFVAQLPLKSHVCDLSKPDGIGDKQLLRRAGSLLGLSEETTTRAKRAIQFGSRSKQIIERKTHDVDN